MPKKRRSRAHKGSSKKTSKVARSAAPEDAGRVVPDEVPDSSQDYEGMVYPEGMPEAYPGMYADVYNFCRDYTLPPSPTPEDGTLHHQLHSPERHNESRPLVPEQQLAFQQDPRPSVVCDEPREQFRRGHFQDLMMGVPPLSESEDRALCFQVEPPPERHNESRQQLLERQLAVQDDLQPTVVWDGPWEQVGHFPALMDVHAQEVRGQHPMQHDSIPQLTVSAKQYLTPQQVSPSSVRDRDHEQHLPLEPEMAVAMPGMGEHLEQQEAHFQMTVAQPFYPCDNYLEQPAPNQERITQPVFPRDVQQGPYSHMHFPYPSWQARLPGHVDLLSQGHELEPHMQQPVYPVQQLERPLSQRHELEPHMQQPVYPVQQLERPLFQGHELRPTMHQPGYPADQHPEGRMAFPHSMALVPSDRGQGSLARQKVHYQCPPTWSEQFYCPPPITVTAPCRDLDPSWVEAPWSPLATWPDHIIGADAPMALPTLPPPAPTTVDLDMPPMPDFATLLRMKDEGKLHPFTPDEAEQAGRAVILGFKTLERWKEASTPNNWQMPPRQSAKPKQSGNDSEEPDAISGSRRRAPLEKAHVSPVDAQGTDGNASAERVPTTMAAEVIDLLSHNDSSKGSKAVEEGGPSEMAEQDNDDKPPSPASLSSSLGKRSREDEQEEQDTSRKEASSPGAHRGKRSREDEQEKEQDTPRKEAPSPGVHRGKRSREDDEHEEEQDAPRKEAPSPGAHRGKRSREDDEHEEEQDTPRNASPSPEAQLDENQSD